MSSTHTRQGPSTGRAASQASAGVLNPRDKPGVYVIRREVAAPRRLKALIAAMEKGHLAAVRARDQIGSTFSSCRTSGKSSGLLGGA